MIRSLFLLAIPLFLSTVVVSQENLKVMYYNLLKFPDVADRADTLKNIIQHTQPDIFVVNELKSTYGANLIMTHAMNVDGVSHYAQAVFQDANGSDTDNHLYYNSNKIGFVEQNNINANTRAISEYILYYNPDTYQMEWLGYTVTYFSKEKGSLGTSGSVSFMFDRKGEFIFDLGERDIDDLELELIDGGADEIDVSEGKVYVYTAYEDFGMMQVALEKLGIEVEEASLQRFPQVLKELSDEEKADLEGLIERFEDDDDVQKVFHGMA